jgi:hypothetical protein
MRYTLRNKDKIKKAYSSQYLDRMVKSLDTYFKTNEEIKEEDSGENFNIIIVSDIEHSVNCFVFYVIKKTYDVYLLAFKEVIG